MNEEIRAAIDSSNAAFEEFKARSDTKIATLERALLGVEVKQNRPYLGASEIEQSAEVKAFSGFLRTGEWDRKAMSTGSGPDGGFAVPKEISAAIETLMLKQSVLRQLCNVERAGTQDYHKLINRRGTTATWVGETSTRSVSATSQLADIAFPDGEMTASPPITQRLLDDSFFNADAWLANELAESFTDAEGDAFINGTGVNKPIGFLSQPTPVTTADATRAFGTLQYTPSGDASAFLSPTSSVSPADCLTDLVYTLKPGYRNGASFVMAPGTLGVVRKMKDADGRFILSPSIAPGTPSTLFGYPVFEDEHMPAVGANAFPIAFGNWKRGYTIVDRWDLRILRDPFTSKPYVIFYAWKRTSGSVVSSDAIKLLKIATS